MAGVFVQIQNGDKRLQYDFRFSTVETTISRLEEPHATRFSLSTTIPMVCMAIEIYLERHSFHVTIADGGEAGLRALEGAAFDLMIVDIFMPHMRGFEFDPDFSRARADDSHWSRCPDTPLRISTRRRPNFLRMALELGRHALLAQCRFTRGRWRC